MITALKPKLYPHGDTMNDSFKTLPDTLKGFLAWDEERGINHGSNARAQWEKLFEEVIELYAALYPLKHSLGLRNDLTHKIDRMYEAGKIKSITQGDDPQPHVEDAVGDCMKCLVTVANLAQVDLSKASQSVLEVINARKGKLNPETGIWEKE